MNDNERHIPASLVEEIGAQCERTLNGDISVLVDEIRSRFGQSLDAIIVYGSCLRTHDFQEGVVDLYVIVNSYSAAYSERHLRVLNAALPPNVFYIEAGKDEKKIRAKYAVLSITDLEKGIKLWFHSYLWSRFAQPVRVLYSRDNEVRSGLYYLFAESVIRFLKTTLPAMPPGEYNTEEIWVNGLTLTYTAELRPEQQSRARHITHQALGDLTRLTKHAADAVPGKIEALARGYYRIYSDSRSQRRCRWAWHLRRWQGRLLSIARLIKAVFTFKDCVEYAAWKIKRHTGITIEVTPVLQRHPILFGFNILWRLLRRDALH